jgi:hypothetical protein
MNAVQKCRLNFLCLSVIPLFLYPAGALAGECFEIKEIQLFSFGLLSLEVFLVTVLASAQIGQLKKTLSSKSSTNGIWLTFGFATQFIIMRGLMVYTLSNHKLTIDPVFYTSIFTSLLPWIGSYILIGNKDSLDPVNSKKSNAFIPAGLLLVAAVVWAGILTPSTRPTRTSTRSPCLNNIRQIGLACKQYAVDNDEKFPNSFRDLIPGDYLRICKIYICPSDENYKLIQKRLDENSVDELSSYVLVRGLTEAVDSDTPLIVEKPHLHQNQGGHVFFVGGQAGFQRGEEFETMCRFALKQNRNQEMNPSAGPIDFQKFRRDSSLRSE